MTKDSWNPQTYHQFAKERNQPFYDLLELIERKSEMSIVDLGCGSGHLTQELHKVLKAQTTLGIDTSQAMLKESEVFKSPSLNFRFQDIEAFQPKEKYDLIFSNAALQWVPNHQDLIKRLSGFLAPEGQIAIQMPANFDYPTHTLAKKLSEEPSFREHLKEGRDPSILTLEEYSDLFYRLGFVKQQVKEQIYPHVLESTDAMIHWVKGSICTYYQSRLSEAQYKDFLSQYSHLMMSQLGQQKPFFFPCKRQLLWAKRG